MHEIIYIISNFLKNEEKEKINNNNKSTKQPARRDARVMTTY